MQNEQKITKEMFENVKKLLAQYQQKVATQGPQSLTNEDRRILQNMGAVCTLVKKMAEEKIITEAIEGNYSKVEDYYYEKGKEISDRYAKYEEREKELPELLIQAIASGEKDLEEKIRAEFISIANVKKQMEEEIKIFEQSKRAPEDFVMDIIKTSSTQEMEQVIRRLVSTNRYTSEPGMHKKSEFYKVIKDPATGELDIVVDEPLVDLAIDYMENRREDYNHISEVNDLLHMKKFYEESEYYLSALQSYINKVTEAKTALDNTQRKINELDATNNSWYRKILSRINGNAYSPSNLGKEYQYRLNMYNSQLKEAESKLQIIGNVCNLLGLELMKSVSFHNIDSVIDFIRNSQPIVNSKIREKIAEIESQIEQIKSKIPSQYNGIALEDIEAITYYGRGRLGTPMDKDFSDALKSLKLLKFVSSLYKAGLEKPEEMIDKPVSNYQDSAEDIIDKYIANQKTKKI